MRDKYVSADGTVVAELELDAGCQAGGTYGVGHNLNDFTPGTPRFDEAWRVAKETYSPHPVPSGPMPDGVYHDDCLATCAVFKDSVLVAVVRRGDLDAEQLKLNHFDSDGYSPVCKKCWKPRHGAGIYNCACPYSVERSG
jgi:hypothetical protein